MGDVGGGLRRGVGKCARRGVEELPPREIDT